MDENNKVSAEELAAEQADLQQSKEEEIRAKVIEEFGFDETNDADRIEKLVKKEVEHKTKLSSAIGQKIKWRTEATKPKEASTPPKPAAQEQEDVSKVIAKTLEQRDLDDMEYPDDIKKEIQRIAQITGKSVKAAAKDPYIVNTYIEPWKAEQKNEAASISRTNRASGKKSFDIDNPPELDTSSPEAYKKSNDAYQAWLKEAQKQGY